MTVIRDAAALPSVPVACVATIGVFDGFHKGHRFITQAMIDAARSKQVASVLITFDIHPKSVHAHEFSGYITHRETKLSILRGMGVDYVWYLPFDAVRDMKPSDFLVYVKKYFDVKTIVVGADFRFAKNAAADVHVLRELGTHFGFEVVSPQRVSADGQTLSSSSIREMIARGDLDAVKSAMGRPFSVVAHVEHGIGAGHDKLHVPTANIDVADRVVPPCGIYATTVVYEGKEYAAVTYLGTAPSMRSHGKPDKLILESHIFDKTFDLYGKRIEVCFHRFIRPEQVFADPDELSAAIKNDIAQAKEYFTKDGSCVTF